MVYYWWVLSLVSLVWPRRVWERERRSVREWERNWGEEGERIGREGVREWGSENFVKCFTVGFLVKYFTSFYAQTLVKLKIFYNFDFILHANKHLKIGKYLTENILHWNKRNRMLFIFLTHVSNFVLIGCYLLFDLYLFHWKTIYIDSFPHFPVFGCTKKN